MEGRSTLDKVYLWFSPVCDGRRVSTVRCDGGDCEVIGSGGMGQGFWVSILAR